ncbi:MAG: DUF5666 domain-containing protein [bacterium]
MFFTKRQLTLVTLLTGGLLYAACGGGGGGAVITTSKVSGTLTKGGLVLASARHTLGDELRDVLSLSRAAFAVGPGIAGATVRVVRGADDTVLGVDTTDAAGAFEIFNVPAGDDRILRVEVQTGQDLDGLPGNDRVKINIPIRVDDSGATTADVELDAVDDNGDGLDDSIEVDDTVNIPGQGVISHHRRHNRRDGFTRTDSNGNNLIDDNDLTFPDNDGDGLANDDPNEHDIDDDGVSNSGDSDDDNDGVSDDADDDADGDGIDDSGEIEFTAFVTALGTANGTLTVGDSTFTVGANTLITNFAGEPITFNDLAVGDLVEIKGLSQPDGTLVATRIHLEDDISDPTDRNGDAGMDPGEIELTGPITSITATSLTVAGTTFDVSANTIVLGENNLPIPYSSLAVGDIVEVKGQQAGSTVTAIRIKMEDDALENNEVEVTGPISALTPNSLTVNNQLFAVNASTVVLGLLEEPIPFSALAVGDLVEVKATVQGQTNTATRIKLEDDADQPDEVEVTGLIEALTLNSITVGGQTYAVTDSTVVLDDNNIPLPFSSLAVGDNVEVKAVPVAGVWTAIRINIEH